jgi:membrane protein DedA with SNARE-associated domain
MEALIAQYGYLAILIGALLEGETVVLLGGFAAHQGYLNVTGVMVVAFVGTLTGDQFFFYLGRLRGKSYLSRRPAWQAKIDRVARFIDTHENLLMLAYRFMYGIRTLTPFALGLANVSRLKYFCFSLFGALVWSATFVAAGYLSGHILTRWLGALKQHEPVIALTILGVPFVIWLVRLSARRYRAHE